MRFLPSSRPLAWSLALIVLVLPLVGLFHGWLASSNWPVRHLEIKANYHHVRASDVREAVMPWVGKGFFATQLSHVREAVDALPWVDSVSVRKRWPDTLQVTIHEYQPFAHWGKTHLMDRQGQLFTVPDAQSVTGLPSFSGPEDSQARVLDFYHRLRPILATVDLDLYKLHLNDRGGWTLELANGSQLMLGQHTPVARLKRFVSVYTKLARTHIETFVYADLRYPNGFAVRWPEDKDKTTQGAAST